jgi:cell division protease FtsH
MRTNFRGLFLWGFLALVLLLSLLMVSQDSRVNVKELQFSQLVQLVKQGKVKELRVKGEEIHGKLADADASSFRAVGPTESEFFLDLMEENDLVPDFEAKPSANLIAVITTVVPMIAIIILFVLLMRQLQSGNNKTLGFGKSKARLLDESVRKVTFKDVAGADEAKEELFEIIEFLRDPRRFTRLGGRIPKGVLLMGGPGTGKTLLARAVAGEAGVPFFSISGSDFVEMFVGVGASRVRDLFEQGKKNAPCIVFIDEIDAVGRHRGAGMGGGHDEREQTLNQLLVEMDGFESNEGVILVAATNRPDVLDPALLRPGRFDRRVFVNNPDIRGREGILAVHTTRTPLGDDVDLVQLARATPGLSGADLENLVNEAALLAARRDGNRVEMADFVEAKDKVSMGVERRSLVVPEGERRRTAFHEAGHALVARLLNAVDRVHKVTIVPRGRALGLTLMMPDEDRLGATLPELLSRLAVYMGGRVAEELALTEISTGASNDLKQATRIARAMVTEYGMSEVVGPLSLEPGDELFLGRDYGRVQEHSAATAQLVDEEVKRLLTDAQTKARELLSGNMHILDALATILLERETLDGAEFEETVLSLNPVWPDAVRA